MGVSAILEHVDLSSALRDAANAATCLLGRLVRKLAEATVSHAHTGGRQASAVSPARRFSTKGRLAGRSRRPRWRRDLVRWCPSDIRSDGDSCSVLYPCARRKRPAGPGAQCASGPAPPRPLRRQEHLATAERRNGFPESSNTERHAEGLGVLLDDSQCRIVDTVWHRDVC